MKRFSLFLSYLFCILGFLVTLGMGIVFPFLDLQTLANVANVKDHALLCYVFSYAIAALVIFADVCLFLLLESIRKSQFFTDCSVRLLRAISWSAIAAGVLAVPLFFFFYRVIFISFIGLFLGVVLRVVADVIHRANEIKDENDATI